MSFSESNDESREVVTIKRNQSRIYHLPDNLEPFFSMNGYVIRKVSTPGEMDTVYRLTHDAYVEKKYCCPQPGGKLIHYPHLDGIPETMVLVAIAQNTIVGTISFTIDGPNGLGVDDDFAQKTNEIRSEGRKLGSCWRIVTKRNYRNRNNVVIGLIRVSVHLIFDQLGIETLLCALNPQHERFYRRLIHFETICRQTSSIHTLKNAPAVLMRLDTENVPKKWFIEK